MSEPPVPDSPFSETARPSTEEAAAPGPRGLAAIAPLRQRVSGNLFRLRLLAVVFSLMIIGSLVVSLTLGARIFEQFNTVDELWETSDAEHSTKGLLLSQIRGIFGYGGFIHNYKNYVLRQDPRLVGLIRRDLDELKSLLSNFEINEISGTEQEALTKIHAVVDEYETKLDEAILATEKRWLPMTTDHLVKIDDTPAIAGLVTLETAWLEQRDMQNNIMRKTISRGRELTTNASFLLPILALAILILPFYLRHLVREISQRQLAETALREKSGLVQLMHSITVTANEAETVDGAMQASLDAICAYTGWPVGHLYVRSPGTPEKIVPTAVWHLDDEDKYATFRETTERMELYKGFGLPGRVFGTGLPEWIEDITKIPNSFRKHINQELGVRAAFALPVSIGSDVVAVLEFFNDAPCPQDDSLLYSLIQVGTQLGRVVERSEIDRMKSEFISTVSHELRTPLTSIQGSLAIIRKAAPESLEAKHQKLVSIAHENSSRLTRLINDILDIEKIETGHIKLNRDLHMVADLIFGAIEENQSYARQHSVAIVPVGTFPHVCVNADSDRIAQVMDNLLSNAAKFSPEGSLVQVSLSRVDQGIRIEVSDQGPGIPEESRDKIFGRFMQADSSNTRKFGGTGLGLNIAKSLVELHGGAIGFESDQGSGTTFHFTLPEYEGTLEDSPDTAASAAS